MKAISRLCLCALALLLAGTSSAFAVNPASTPEVKAADLDKLWEDLASTDEGKVARALLGLSAAPPQTLALLKERLQPIDASEKHVKELVAALDSDEFSVRERAFAQLDYLGKYARPALEKILADKPSAEVKRRIEELLAKLPRPEGEKQPANPVINGGGAVQVQVQIVNGKVIQKINGVDVNQPVPMGPTGPPPQWVRAARAVALLEHLNTPEARTLLEAMAKGEADAQPTKDAKAALDRLKK